MFFTIVSSLAMALQGMDPNSIVSRSTAIRVTATNIAAALTLPTVSTSATTVSVDSEYPGTAVPRMLAARKRVGDVFSNGGFDGDWGDVRRKLLWCGGLRDLPDAAPGQGYTGHAFNDFNHVDLTCMAEIAADNENDGAVAGIAVGNRLGTGIRTASLPELGAGGSWSTCAIGCAAQPAPRDVAHVQFRARIAFKLVWVPADDDAAARLDRGGTVFVLVDDAGTELARGRATGKRLPALEERRANYELVKGSKYARAVDSVVARTTS